MKYNGPVTRSMAKKMKKLPMLMIICLVSSSIFPTTNANDSKCDIKEKITAISSNYCTKQGIMVYRRADETLCYNVKTCPVGHLDGKGKCGKSCKCPDWAQKCSYFIGKEPKHVGNIDQILENAEPNVCSYTKDTICHPEPYYENLNQIQLLNGTKYFVRNLAIAWLQPAINDYICFGDPDSDTSGTPIYCQSHNCNSRSRRFSYYQNNDIAYYLGQNNEKNSY